MRPAILCIGGLDPSGWAGLLADAVTVWTAGGRPLAVATAWTLQTRRGVRGFRTANVAHVLAQLEVLFDDEAPAAVKIGMLGRADLAISLSKFLKRRLGRRPLVIDPVLRASSGAPLFGGNPAAYEGLFRLATAVTPNLLEAATLLRMRSPLHWDRAAMTDAARALCALGPKAVILKGGHAGGTRSDDLLYDAHGARWFEARRIPGASRGTGCKLAAALATRLALGESLPDSMAFAKTLVRRSLSAEAHR